MIIILSDLHNIIGLTLFQIPKALTIALVIDHRIAGFQEMRGLEGDGVITVCYSSRWVEGERFITYGNGTTRYQVNISTSQNILIKGKAVRIDNSQRSNRA
jgi:hypothetical protein